MKHKIKEEYTVIIFSVCSAIFIWIVDAAYDSFISHEGSFFRLLLHVSLREQFLRVVLALGILVFGIVAAKILSKRKRSEESLKKHISAIEVSMDGIAVYNRGGAYVYVNQAYALINGYAIPEELMGKTCRLAYGDQEFQRIQGTVEPALQKSGQWRGELLAKRKNGSNYFQEASVTLLEDGSRVCIIRDITWRKKNEERLRRSESFLNTIFDSIHDPFCILDRDFQFIRVNDAYARMKSKHISELIGKKCHDVLLNSATVCEGCVVNTTLHSADPCAKEKRLLLNEGTDIWVEIYTYPILDEEGKVSHVIEYTRDITDRKKSEDENRRLIEKLAYLSNTDSLTGLVNRRALTDSLIYEIDRARRYGAELSLILCDIDNFKEINDTYGHGMGDRVLQAIAANLKSILRKADIAGRHGGDEFMIILPGTSIKGAESLAKKLLVAVRDTDLRFTDNAPIRLSMSIGISGFEADNDSTDSFIKRTDDALYASKQGGRNKVSTVKQYPLFP